MKKLHFRMYFCHMKGHNREGCYKLIKCDFCHQTSHVMDTYYKIIIYPTNFKSKKKNNHGPVDHPPTYTSKGT